MKFQPYGSIQKLTMENIKNHQKTRNLQTSIPTHNTKL